MRDRRVIALGQTLLNRFSARSGCKTVSETSPIFSPSTAHPRAQTTPSSSACSAPRRGFASSPEQPPSGNPSLSKPNANAHASSPSPSASTSTSTSAAAETATTSGGITAEQQMQAAERASSMMFPWERYQMDNANKPLRTWEKFYWWGFVVILAYFLFTWGKEKLEAQPDEDQKDRERRAKLEFGSVMVGLKQASPPPTSTNVGATVSYLGVDLEDDDPFDGMSPLEVQKFIWKEVMGYSEEKVQELERALEDTSRPLPTATWRESLPSLPMHLEYEGQTPEEIDRAAK